MRHIGMATLIVAAIMGAGARPAHADERPAPVHLQGWHEMRDGRLRALISDREAMQHYRPCEYEDSTNCWWDARSQGNGRGHSLVAVTRQGWICIAYLNPTYANHHDRCIEGDL